MNTGHFRLGLLVGVVAGIVACLGGLWLTGLIESGEADRVTEAQAVIEDSYWKGVDTEELDEASIRGMVEELRKDFDDRFSHYFSPEQLRAFNESSSGRFSGVGLTVTEVPKGLRIAAVIPDSPAAAADIREGELITAVDGESIAGVSSDVAVARIKGPEGTAVDLEITDPGNGSREIEVERATVRVPAVAGRIERTPEGEKVAYVRLSTFSSGAHGELRAEVDRLDRLGAQGLVLDLRGNGGGLLNEAILTASVFLEQGEEVVSTQSRTEGDDVYTAEGGAVSERPIVILTDKNTASASEILTAALLSYDLAETVGERTYGKGVFQRIIELPQGGALDLTVGEYLTADGKSLAGAGIRPDEPAADDPDTEPDEALEEGLAVLGREL